MPGASVRGAVRRSGGGAAPPQSTGVALGTLRSLFTRTATRPRSCSPEQFARVGAGLGCSALLDGARVGRRGAVCAQAAKRGRLRPPWPQRKVAAYRLEQGTSGGARRARPPGHTTKTRQAHLPLIDASPAQQQPANRATNAACRAWPVTLGSRSRATAPRCCSARSRRRRWLPRRCRSAGQRPRLSESVRQR